MRQFEGLVAPWHYRSISKCPRAALKIRLLLPKTLTILPPRVPHCRVVINWKLAKVMGTNCLSYVSFEPACKFKLFHRWRSCQDSQKTSREWFQGFWTEEVCQGQTWCFKFSFVCILTVSQQIDFQPIVRTGLRSQGSKRLVAGLWDFSRTWDSFCYSSISSAKLPILSKFASIISNALT